MAQAQPAPLCAAVFESSSAGDLSSFLGRLNAVSSRLQRLVTSLRGGLAQRVLRDPEARHLSDRLFERPVITAMESDFKAFGLTFKVRKAFHRDRMVFSIPTVFSMGPNGRLLPADQAPPGLDMSFSKLIVVIFEVAAREAARHPEVKFLEINAETVLNQRLIRLFQEMGFEKQGLDLQGGAWMGGDPMFGGGGGPHFGWVGNDPLAARQGDRARTWQLKIGLKDQ
ncbi:MAG: hypothetical protein KF865_08780 [Bdellovibrionaceae bacterium]|nr:hypothetical protein [Pseudobdellovibrionaceae bacterium]